MAKKKYTPVTDEHHVVRRCGFQVIERDTLSDRVVGLHPAAIRLRVEINEKYLSVNWLEHCAGTKIERLKAIVATHRAKARTRLSPRSGVAILKTGRILELGTNHGHRLTVLFVPTGIDPSYSRISGLPLDNSDALLIDSLRDEAYKDFMLLADVDAQP